MTEVAIELVSGLWDSKTTKCQQLSFLSPGQLYSISVLAEAYGDASALLYQMKKPLAPKETFLLESYRLAIMKSIYLHMHPKAKQDTKKIPLKKSIFAELKQHIGLILLLFAGVVGTVETAVWTYFGAVSAFTALVPTIITATLVPLAVMCTVIGVMQFIGFDVDQVMRLFGISLINSKQKYFDIEIQQVDLVNKINERLANCHFQQALLKQATATTPLPQTGNVVRDYQANLLRNEHYTDYYLAANVFNMDIQYKKDHFKPYRNSIKGKIARAAVTVSGLLLAMIESYFGTQMLMGMIATSIALTPVATIATVTVMAATAIFYFSMRGFGLDAVFNATQDKSKKLQKNLDQFEQHLHLNPPSMVLPMKPLEKSFYLQVKEKSAQLVKYSNERFFKLRAKSKVALKQAAKKWQSAKLGS